MGTNRQIRRYRPIKTPPITFIATLGAAICAFERALSLRPIDGQAFF
jgi:hypothetical protein